MGEEKNIENTASNESASAKTPISKTASKPQRILVYLILFIVLAGAVYLSWRQNLKISSYNQAKSKLPTPTPPQYTYQLPVGFPNGMPIETGAVTVNTSSGKIVGSKGIVATREFISSKTVDANFAFYQNWLKANSWQNIAPVDQPTQKMLIATLKKNSLTIRIFTAADGKVHVAITNILSQ